MKSVKSHFVDCEKLSMFFRISYPFLQQSAHIYSNGCKKLKLIINLKLISLFFHLKIAPSHKTYEARAGLEIMGNVVKGCYKQSY